MFIFTFYQMPRPRLFHQRTVLSLNTKRDILSLPGFEHLDNYLLSELKAFVRQRLNEYTHNNPRGFAVSQFAVSYEADPQPYTPAHPTARRMRTRPTARQTPPPPPANQQTTQQTTNDVNSYDATNWSHYTGSKKDRKNALIKAKAQQLLEEAKTYDATDWSHYTGSKKERKDAVIKAAKEAKRAAKKQRRKENKAKRAAQHQANWEKQRAEREEAKLRDAEIKERMARKKFFENIKSNGKLIQSARKIKKEKDRIELIKGHPVKIMSVENQADWEKQRAAEREERARKKFFGNIKSNGKLIQSANNIKKLKNDLGIDLYYP